MAGDTVKVKTTLEVDHVDITEQAKKEVQEQLFSQKRVNLPAKASRESWYMDYVFDSMRKSNSEMFTKWGSTINKLFDGVQPLVATGIKDLFKSIDDTAAKEQANWKWQSKHDYKSLIVKTGVRSANELIQEINSSWIEEVKNMAHPVHEAIMKGMANKSKPFSLPDSLRDTTGEEIAKGFVEHLDDIKEGLHETVEWTTDEQYNKAVKILETCKKNAEEFSDSASKSVKDTMTKKEAAEHRAMLQRETNRLKELDKRETMGLRQEYAKELATFKSDEWIRAKKEYYDYRVDKRTEGTFPRFFDDLKQTLKDTVGKDLQWNKEVKEGKALGEKDSPGKILEDLKDGLKDLFSTTSTKKLGMNILATLGKTAVSILMNVLKTAFNLFKSLFKGVVKALLLPAKKLIGLFKSLIKSALQHSQIYYAIQRILDTPLIIMLEYLLIPLLKVVIPAVTKMIKFVVDNKDAILRWGEVLASFVDSTILQPMLASLNESFLNNPFAGVFNMMSDIFKAMLSWVHDNKDKIGEIVEETINAVGEMLVSSATLAGVIIEVLGTALLEAINGGLLERLITPLTTAVYMVFDIIKKILEQPEIHNIIMSIMVMFIDLFMQSLGAFASGAVSAAGKGIEDFGHDVLGFNSPAQFATIPWMINPMTWPMAAAQNTVINSISTITNNNYESKSEMKDITSAGAISV